MASYFASWLGRARLTFTHSAKPIGLETTSGSTVSLLDLCQSVTPPCHLNPFLFNGHLQTCWTALKEFVDIPIYYKRHVFQADQEEYAGEFAVDFVVPPYEGEDPELPPRTTYFTDEEFGKLGRETPSTTNGLLDGTTATGAEALGDDDDRPMLICLHGLTGGSYESYLRAVLEPLVEAGWAACVINSRGCAKSRITTSVLYNARSTWDCRQMVKWCRQRWPKRKLYGIGFSLGASMLTNYCGEEADKCILEAAVVCSNPWTLEVGSLALQRTILGKELYSRTLGKNLKNLFERHVDVLAQNPRINVDRVRNVKYMHEFDRELQCPTWGYPTEGAYYRDATSTDALMSIRIPFFAINAEDDPVAVSEAIPWQEFKHNPYAVLLTTSIGGHLAWFEVGGRRWFGKPASKFLMKMAKEVKSIEEPSPKAEITTRNIQLSEQAPTFCAARHKLRMPGID